MRNREEENVVNLTGIVGADGQVRIFPDEGLPDDYEDARYKQTKEFFLKASAEEVEANDEKKRATSIFKTKERHLHYAAFFEGMEVELSHARDFDDDEGEGETDEGEGAA